MPRKIRTADMIDIERQKENERQKIVSTRIADLAKVAAKCTFGQRVKLLSNLNTLILEQGRRGMTLNQIKELAEILEGAKPANAEEVILTGMIGSQALRKKE